MASKLNLTVLELRDIIAEFGSDIEEVSSNEIRDILKAIITLKKESGWGKIEITYTNHELKEIEIVISKKIIK